jgi:hypothetical protein
MVMPGEIIEGIAAAIYLVVLVSVKGWGEIVSRSKILESGLILLP